MPRIRSIKPEFWKSEAIGRLPRGTRLTFIGLWTYVDDNGVGIDNPKLISAELYPLEDDPRETLAMVSRELDELSNAGRILRYVSGNRRYLAITNWLEHQKIDRPGKARYPQPSDADIARLTCGNTDPRETLARVSRGFDESQAPDQGSGIREQGTGNRDQGTRDSVAPSRKLDHNTDPTFAAFWDRCAVKSGKPSAYKAWLTAIKKPGVDPQMLCDRMGSYAGWVRATGQDHPKWPQGWLTDERWADHLPEPTQRQTAASTRPVEVNGQILHLSDRSAEAMRDVERYRQQDEAARVAALGMLDAVPELPACPR